MVARPHAGPGLRKALRGAVRRSRGGPVLDRAAEEALFRHARVLSEGAPADGSAETRFFGSTMVTVDLDLLMGDVRGLEGSEGRRSLLELVCGSARVHLRLMRMARADAWSRCPDGVLGTAQVEVRARLDGGMLLLDVDLEAPLERASAEL